MAVRSGGDPLAGNWPIARRRWFADARRRNANGESITVLAEEYGVRPVSLRRAIEREGGTVFYPLEHQRRRKGARPDRHTEKPLSLRLGVERSRVEAAARQAGIPVRRWLLDAIREKLDREEGRD